MREALAMRLDLKESRVAVSILFGKNVKTILTPLKQKFYLKHKAFFKRTKTVDCFSYFPNE